MKTFKCTRLRLCNYLMDRGFFPYRVEPDPSSPRYKIYLFEETPALTAATGKKTNKEGCPPHTDWCHNRDLNPDAIWQQILNLPCLPVPTLWHKSPAEAGQVIIPQRQVHPPT